MDKIAFIMAATLAAIALTFIMLSVTASTQAGTGAQEKPDDQQTVLVKGYCNNEGCVIDAVKECRLSETTVRDASNRTTIISVGGDAIHQGQPVCLVGIYEEDMPDTTSFQSWSCKVPVAELQDSTFADVDELAGKLAASEHCAVQVP